MDAEEVAPTSLRPQASAPPLSELDMPHVVVLGSYPEQEENPVLALVPLQEPAIQGSGAAGGGGGRLWVFGPMQRKHCDESHEERLTCVCI